MRPVLYVAIIVGVAIFGGINMEQANIIQGQRATIKQLSMVPFCPASPAPSKEATPSLPKKQIKKRLQYQQFRQGNPLLQVT